MDSFLQLQPTDSFAKSLDIGGWLLQCSLCIIVHKRLRGETVAWEIELAMIGGRGYLPGGQGEPGDAAVVQARGNWGTDFHLWMPQVHGQGQDLLSHWKGLRMGIPVAAHLRGGEEKEP